jgi:hypothetical protein
MLEAAGDDVPLQLAARTLSIGPLPDCVRKVRIEDSSALDARRVILNIYLIASNAAIGIG